MEEPVEKKSRTDEVDNIAVVLYGVDDLKIVEIILLFIIIMRLQLLNLLCAYHCQTPPIPKTSGSA